MSDAESENLGEHDMKVLRTLWLLENLESTQGSTEFRVDPWNLNGRAEVSWTVKSAASLPSEIPFH